MSNRNSSDKGNESDNSASSTTVYGSEPLLPTPSSTGTVNDSTPSLSLAEQDRLYGTIVVPQSLPEPWFPDGNLCKIMWDLPCEYQGSIWPHYCEHYKAFHYVTRIRKYSASEQLGISAIPSLNQRKITLSFDAAFRLKNLRLSSVPAMPDVGLRKGHVDGKVVKKVPNSCPETWIKTSNCMPIPLFTHPLSMETLTHTVVGKNAKVESKMAHLELVKKEHTDATLYLTGMATQPGETKDECQETGCIMVPMALPAHYSAIAGYFGCSSVRYSRDVLIGANT
ncbi:hypothetical protein ARMSODRAFT_977469 [Armillaria solidipes]|uniref:Uncharacterized protein n=1 Tax=Armillaria solidipes TaxID=1076256 RepID=A0A2H3B6Q9_9AGAR|nr:hypothetical protein ARMSODRAFT_977469 [Armillaria solidipes]